jgi:hydrogenase maturation protease
LTGTIVLGLGNLVHRDDGAGVHAIHGLQREERIPPDVTLIDGGTQGLSLIPHICGVERLLVIDAIDASEPPGTLLRFEGLALRGMPGKATVHQLGFADLMVALELIGEPAGEVVLLGIQPESTDWGAELTPKVERALPALIDCVVEQLEAWHHVAVAAR